MIKFSIVIPTYNRSHTIGKTLDSIEKQTYKNYEIIIIDDNSSDSLYSVVQSFNVKYYFNKKNRGCNYSKNYGAKKSSGDYLIFLDSDDQFYEDSSLEKIKNIISENNFPNTLMFSCIDLEKNLISHIKKNGYYSLKDIIKNSIKGEFLPVVKKNFFNENSFIESLRGGEGLTWKKHAKLSKIYYSQTIVRLYDNLGSDRMSYRSKLNAKRFIQINNLEINNYWISYLKYNPLGLLKLIMSSIFNYIFIIFK